MSKRERIGSENPLFKGGKGLVMVCADCKKERWYGPDLAKKLTKKRAYKCQSCFLKGNKNELH